MASNNEKNLGPSEKMNIESSSIVVQSNAMIQGRQSLTPIQAKLVRMCIAQVIGDDVEFKPYQISISELGSVLGLSKSNLYRDAKEICEGIIKKPIILNSGKSWRAIPWVSLCEYVDNTGMISIKLNDELKPYLLQLKDQFYTKYSIENILRFKSIYSIRLFELLQMKLGGKIPLISGGTTVTLSIEEIRLACECADKYSQLGPFKKYVIDAAVKEINASTMYHITYETPRDGRKIERVVFVISTRYGISEK